MSIVMLRDINKSFKSRRILDHVSLEIEQGDMIGIIGRSGSGKTTLLNIAGLLDFPDGGQLYFNSKRILENDEAFQTRLRRDSIGFVVQDYALINHHTIFNNIALPLYCKGIKKKQIKSSVFETAESLGICDILSKYPYEISGGEAQRASIARALIRKPDVILADEPTGALDTASEQTILQLFAELNRDGIAILIVTHNPAVIQICKQIYELTEGRLIKNQRCNALSFNFELS
jgi:putative ABC transport system ATP-binding protein